MEENSRFNKKNLVLFALVNLPFVVLFFVSPQILRLAVIFVAFLAMYSLWDARKKRHHLWTAKMKDIWLSQILWTVAAAEGNIELWYRHTQPSVALLLVSGILLLTIKGAFNQEKYLINQP